MKGLPDTAAELLGPDGPLARHIQGFNHRPQQQVMAQAIADTMQQGGLPPSI